MALFDGLPEHDGTSVHRDEEGGAAPFPRAFPTDNLAPGIVWADVLADIAADERARRTQELTEAA